MAHEWFWMDQASAWSMNGRQSRLHSADEKEKAATVERKALKKRKRFYSWRANKRERNLWREVNIKRRFAETLIALIRWPLQIKSFYALKLLWRSRDALSDKMPV